MARTTTQKERSRRPCALCGLAPSSPDGEHVLPRWLLRALLPPECGPYRTAWAGLSADEPAINTSPTFPRAKLACCEKYNAELNRRFENPGAGPARRLFETDRPAFTSKESQDLTLWILKTWLLLAHPQTEFKPGLPRPRPWNTAPPEVFAWLVNGQAPQAGLSAWAFRHDRNHGEQSPGSTPRLQLPTVVADGIKVTFLSLDLTLKLVNVALVFHPGWRIAHPDVPTGRVVTLWPGGKGAALPPLPSLGHQPLAWVDGPELHFLPNTYSEEALLPLVPDVPPDSLVTDLLAFAAAPRIR